MAHTFPSTSVSILQERYAHVKADGTKETVEEIFRRVANAIAKAEENWVTHQDTFVRSIADQFYDGMINRRWMPNSPCLANAGYPEEFGKAMAACYVLGLDDSIASVMETASIAAQIHKSGGGTGFDFSPLREKGSRTRGATASGPTSFMKIINETTEQVKQAGCWSGDTLIATVSGNIPIRDLVDVKTYVYSWDIKNRKLVVRPTDGAWKTKTITEVWELTTDKGITVRATPDHPIMMRSGLYKKLSELKPGMTLMPLRRTMMQGEVYVRPTLLQGTHQRAESKKQINIPLHQFVYQEMVGHLKDGYHVHHKDEDHYNNHPSNLDQIPHAEHSRIHNQERVDNGVHVFQTQKFPKVGEQNGMHTSRFWANKTPEEIAVYRSKIGSPGDNNPMRRDTGAREKVSAYGKTQEAIDIKMRGKILKTAIRILELGLPVNQWDAGLTALNLPNICRIKRESVLRLFGSFEALDQEVHVTNDRVLSVRFVGYEDVYNLEVEETHNYAVTSDPSPGSRGIFVSNTRRGANMGVLRCDHPDLLRFIDAKRETRYITYAPGELDDYGVQKKSELLPALNNFNVSVTCTDAFMDAVEHNLPWALYSRCPYTPGLITQTLPARDIWNKIIQSAWANGDPGVLFIDRANNSRSNPIPEVETIATTNPCGEIFLGKDDVCNLISLNLDRFWEEPDGESAYEFFGDVNWDLLEHDVRLCVRFMDNLIEINPIPIPQIKEKNLQLRRIAVGVMGWADLLNRMHIPYDSEDALALAERVMGFISKKADEASSDLALTRGSFPLHPKSIYKDSPMRNGQRTAIMPTGTISIIAGCSSGIEPLFGLSFTHNNQLGRQLKLDASIFEQAVTEARHYNASYDWDGLLDHVKTEGSLHGFPGLIPHEISYFRTAHEVAPEWHIRHQATFQAHLDNACSKSINLPENATVGDVENCYWLAWRSGCKGITIFRDGCLKERGQVLNLGVKTAAAVAEETSVEIIQRPQAVPGITHQLKTPLGTLYVTVNVLDDRPIEVFCTVGKAGSDTHATAETIGRLISLYFRRPYASGETVHERVHELVHQLSNIGGRSQVGIGPNRVRSIGDAVALVLEKQFLTIDKPVVVVESPQSTTKKPQRPKADLCPKCGEACFVRGEGCQKCLQCGYSEC